MAIVTRCDECKKLSDVDGISYIGKKWELEKFKNRIATLTFTKDLCRNCVKNLIEENSLYEFDHNKDY